jgi:hypothetical protein
MIGQMEMAGRTMDTVGTVLLSLTPSAHGDCVLAPTKRSAQFDFGGRIRPTLNLEGPTRPRFVARADGNIGRANSLGRLHAPTCDARTAKSARIADPIHPGRRASGHRTVNRPELVHPHA